MDLLILPPREPVHLAREAALRRDVLLLLVLLLFLVVPGRGEAGEARGVDSGDTVTVPHTVISLRTVTAEGLTGKRVTAKTAGRIRAAAARLNTDAQSGVVMITTGTRH